ncbi:MAG: kelch repeat-containing protein [Tannerellaceae bacterium]|nr:kelch repeat-containing protein [Tannerellaceae bacterium]MCD8263903.1 kelch repeat-containing protein [Tannerellaceae bacterium]
MLVAGRDENNELLNTAWSTFDGLEWMKLTDDRANFFEQKEGAMLTLYDDKYYLIGGIDKDNIATKDMYVSIDKGVSWATADSLVILPEAYKARGFASIYVDDNDYMLIFGGKESRNGNVLDQIWRGRINRLGFSKK